jgi:hypothetical protein
MFGKKDKAGITAWADALKANTSITELNLAKNGINANDTKILAPAISDNGAMTSLNISSNRIGWLSVPDGWETRKSQNGDYQVFKPPGQDWTMDAPPGAKAEGIIAIANAIPDMGALLSLDMSNNGLNGWSNSMDFLGPAVASSTITSLNIASNDLNQNGGIDAVVSMLDKGAISSFIFSGERYHEGSWKDAPAVTMETSMTEADFSGKHLGVSGVSMLSAFLPKCT